MAIARAHVFISNETLTAALVNAEFNNILNNLTQEILDVISASGIDLDGMALVIDTDGDLDMIESADDVVAFRVGSTELFKLDLATASAVNGLELKASAASNAVGINSFGSDTDVHILVTPKGAGTFRIAPLTASRALATDANKGLVSSATTSTELGYVNGVTSAIQTQINGKITAGAAAIVNADVNASAAIALSKLAALTASRAAVTDGSGFLSASSVTGTEQGYLSGVTSAIQTQLNTKAATSAILGKHTIFVPASAMFPQTTNGCSPLAQVEFVANDPEYFVLDFDGSSIERAQFIIALPKSWNESSIQFRVFWTSSATDADGVVWKLIPAAFEDGEATTSGFSAVASVTDNAQSTANDIYVSAFSGNLTVTGAAENALTWFRVERAPADASDTMAEDARLLGISITYTIDALNDS